MKIVISVAIYNSQERLNNFVNSLINVVDKEYIDVVFLNTGPESDVMRQKAESLVDYGFHVRYIDIEDKPRAYAEIIKQKISITSDLCGINDIFYNSDDDYIFNPWTFEIIKEIFEENKDVTYLSPIWCGADPSENFEIEIKSGIKFYKTGSALGGAFCARAKEFIPDALAYFLEGQIDPMFDQGFWRYVSKLNPVSNDKFIYTLADYSLIQHCNMTSHYLHMKKDDNDHMGGINYLENQNPYDILRRIDG